jgi:hypothetical protein
MGKPLRVVPDMEPTVPDQSLLEAIASGNVLEMLLAQRRLIASALIEAQDNTRPQYNNELNKLHALIAAEQARIAAEFAAKEGEGGTPSGGAEPRPFDPASV